ncbi:MAG: putative drug exporter of the superfamily, partial [Mycobacterium sp.]|nr:putative drug exporter of the superfamily [Mycobacterium sp.]
MFGRPLRDEKTRLSRSAILVVGLWVVAAALGNVLVPQLERVIDTHARSFMPTDAPSSIAASRA